MCTIGPPSLSVLLELLTAQTCRFIYTKEAQNLLHCLSMSIIHHCGERRKKENNSDNNTGNWIFLFLAVKMKY